MSSSYVRYPPPVSSINLLTTVGVLEVSLWTTELLASSKLFTNLLRYGWYKDAKVTKGIKGVGWQVTPNRTLKEIAEAKEWITKQNAATARNPHDAENMTFPLNEDGEMMIVDHTRIDFTHRGILAFTSTPTSPSPFGEFMLTCSEASFLSKDGYNIFGVVQGNTLFNATRILDKVLAGEEEYKEGEGDEEEGRLVKMSGWSSDVGFEAVDEGLKTPWNEVKVAGKKKKKRNAVKDNAVLSFGGNEDDDEEEGGNWKNKMKKEKKKKKKEEGKGLEPVVEETKEVVEPVVAPPPPKVPKASKKEKHTPAPAAPPAADESDEDEEEEEEMSLVEKMRAKYKKKSSSGKKRKKDKEKEVLEKMMLFKESVKKVKMNGGKKKGESYYGQVLEKGEEDDDDEEEGELFGQVLEKGEEDDDDEEEGELLWTGTG
eukprot:CAMPEP_0118663978 /NCGR_PEP_ID=MMETSP0785-20121206/17748_1 /TAXON_ID=91992 /ORGANISM="Bolidomonas pacifica, Strain CCMP 1866" /LENGTH=428 /DNA_ID=CAMNT_0006557815 /DNA_START=39 /DNA_END=1322 /DNA_ORIENTATION=-